MNNILTKTPLIAIYLFTLLTFSQSNLKNNTDGLSLNEGSIDSQFEYVLKKSGNFKGSNGQAYEAVKQSWLIALRTHALDSIKIIRKNLNKTREVVKSQANEIESLKLNLSNTKKSLESTNTEKNNMSLFGLQMSKANYNILMWSIIGLLLVLLLFFIYKFKNSNAITKTAKLNLEEIELKFEEHRKVALEREQKVRRQLQDEINKQKNI